ncbi:MAG: putative lipid II flippase FtsW [Patescibacteria group bacterium]
MKTQTETLKLRSQKKTFDYWLIGVTALLVLIGLIVIYDASVVAAYRDFNDKFHYIKNQLIWTALGAISLTFFSFFNYHRLLKFSSYFLGLSVFFLILVLIPHVGTQVLGARRWINIGSFNFQPSEFAKLAVVFYATFIIDKFENYKMTLLDIFIVYFLPILITTTLVIIQPDLGTALIFFAITIIIYFIGNAPIWHFLLTVPFAIVSALVAIATHPYRIDRIKAFLDPNFDPQGASYQINQIIIALASGGLLGVGIGASRGKFEFIPEVHSDAIFAVLVEELGFLGAFILVGLFLFLITRAINIARNAPDYQGKVLASGIVALIAVQTLFNLAAIVALVPLTGIPLPFISYGGSSLFVTLSAIGILLNIKKQS